MSTYFELEDLEEEDGTENTEEQEVKFVHFATVVTYRSHSVIVPERTNVFVHVPIGGIEAKIIYMKLSGMVLAWVILIDRL